VPVVCLGEVLVDVAPDGEEFPGGAPANVAFHAAQLGFESGLVSRIGCDERGARLRKWLEAAKVGVGGMREDEFHPTGAVCVRLTAGEPSYEIGAPAAWDFIGDCASVRESIRGARVVVFGTLAQRSPVSRQTIRSLVGEARRSGSLALADLNLREPFYDDDCVLWSLRHCDVLKMNRSELRIVSRMLGARGEDRELFTGMLGEFCIPRGVLTGGADGAWFAEGGEWHHQRAARTEVEDTVGAGDVFTSVLSAFLAEQRTLREAAPWCAEAAAFVCSRRGATPDLPRELVAGIGLALRRPWG